MSAASAVFADPTPAALGVDEATDTAALLRDLPAPLPSAGVAAYAEERERACAADPVKRANYERFRAAQRGAKVDYLPVKLDIENVSRCNLHCIMCIVSDWPKGRRGADMSLETFKSLIDEQVGLLEIKLQGIGEPTLQRDTFFEMIRYARSRHIWVRTTTNATLLHLNDNAYKLIDADPNEIQISIDGADRATFEAIRRGAVFDQVVDNCTRINAYSRDKGVVRTKMWTVVQRDNIHQLEALVDLAARMGFENQVFSLSLSDWGSADWQNRNAAVDVQQGLVLDRLHGLVDRGRRHGVRVGFWTVNEKYRRGSPATLCPWPFERAYIGSDGRVSPCCYIGNPDVYQIGRPLAEAGGFTAVWNGEDYARFRQMHLDGDLPDVCRGCYRDD